MKYENLANIVFIFCFILAGFLHDSLAVEGDDLGIDSESKVISPSDSNIPVSQSQAVNPATLPVPKYNTKSPNPNSSFSNLQPFGSNLFEGNFSSEREDGIDSSYLVATGDRIAIQAWGALEVNDSFVVDGQGNIFIPTVGPVKVLGVANSALTRKIKASIKRVYISDFGVYTNLLSAKPIAVYVTGFVNNPGRYAGLGSDSPLFFLDRAEGIDHALGSYRDIEIRRKKKVLAQIDLYDFLISGEMPKIQFKDGDTIIVKKRGDVVALTGNVAKSKLIEFKVGQYYGNDTLKIIPELSTATEITIKGMRNGSPLLKTMSLADFKIATLQDGDEIMVRGEGKSSSMLITLEGEFNGSSVIAIKRNAKLIDVLNHISVNLEIADIDSIHIRRKSVAKAQKDAINDALYRLEKSSYLALSDTQGEVAIRKDEAALMSQFVERAKQIETLGRVVTSHNGQQSNILLEADDVIVIPQKTNIVQIGGEVFMSQAVVYNKDMDLSDYIERSGGFTDRADEGRIIILRANGETLNSRNTHIQAGDQILVTPEVDSKIIQNAIDLTEVIYKIAIAAGVLVSI